MGTNELTTTELEVLAAKLDALDLTDGERRLLLAVFDSVVDPSGWVGADVHGFGITIELDAETNRVGDPRSALLNRPRAEPERLSSAFLKLFGH